jgi:predicted negative regulator of RcsB-dependent stress response
VAVLSGRNLRAVLLAAAGAVLFTAVVAAWSLRHRLPIVETRRFLTAPVELGDAPRPAPAVPAGPADVERRFADAHDAFAAGRWTQAGDAFAFVVTQNPTGPHAGEAQWNLVRSRLRSGDGTAALDAFDDLLHHHAAYLGEQAPGLRDGLGRMQAGDLPGAQAAFERMIHDQPDSEFVPVAHALIARIHWTHNEPMETVRSFARMFASVKDAVPAYRTLAQNLDRYAQGDTDVADSFARQAREGPDGFRDIYQYLAARSLLEQNRYQAAHDALVQLQQKYPDGDFSHIVDLEEAWNLLRNGRAAEALAIFERLEKTAAPTRTRAFDEFFDLRSELPMGIARCQLALGHYAEAVAAFERALAEHPATIYGVGDRVGMAMAYEHLGRFDRAAAVLREAIEGHPDEPKLWALRQQLARIEAEEKAAAAPQAAAGAPPTSGRPD